VALERGWWEEVADAARAERVARRHLATDVRTLVEAAQVLAGTLARVTLGAAPALVTVTATLIADSPLGYRVLKARPASPPTVHGDGPTRELVTRIELVDSDDRFVGDVQFVWRVDEPDR
jgi:hypothetical protein